MGNNVDDITHFVLFSLLQRLWGGIKKSNVRIYLKPSFKI